MLDLDIREAIKRGNVLELLLLLEGNDMDYLDDQYKAHDMFPLMVHATIERQAGIIQALISKGADVNRLDVSGTSALHVACENLDYEIAKILLDAGANVSTFDQNNYTPLHWVMRRNGSGDHMVGLLLQYGADPDAGKSAGLTTPYEFAVRIRNTHCFNILATASGRSEC